MGTTLQIGFTCWDQAAFWRSNGERNWILDTLHLRMAQRSVSRKLEQQALKTKVSSPFHHHFPHLFTWAPRWMSHVPRQSGTPSCTASCNPLIHWRRLRAFSGGPKNAKLRWSLILVVVSMRYSTVMIKMIEYTVYTKWSVCGPFGGCVAWDFNGFPLNPDRSVECSTCMVGQGSSPREHQGTTFANSVGC